MSHCSYPCSIALNITLQYVWLRFWINLWAVVSVTPTGFYFLFFVHHSRTVKSLFIEDLSYPFLCCIMKMLFNSTGAPSIIYTTFMAHCKL